MNDETIDLCDKCGTPIHPCIPCGEAISYVNHVDSTYCDLLQLILKKGIRKKNRTGVDTISVFGAQAKFDVDLNAFPVLTTKKIFLRSVIHELLWFLKGDTNIKYLIRNGVNIWNEWAYKKYFDCTKINGSFEGDKWMRDNGDNTCSMYTLEQFVEKIKMEDEFANRWGDLGEGTYGGMWRAFPYLNRDEIDHDYVPNTSVDQIANVIHKLKTNPDDRRMIVSAWHPYWVDHCALPPCHCLFHFNTEELNDGERVNLFSMKVHAYAHEYGITIPEVLGQKIFKLEDMPTRKLNCLLYQRSVDTALGAPFNITSYCLLTAMVAHVTNMVPGVFTHTYGDLHIYVNHLDGVKEQLTRTPKVLPKLWLNPDVKNIEDFKFEDIQIRNYISHPAIKFDIAV